MENNTVFMVFPMPTDLHIRHQTVYNAGESLVEEYVQQAMPMAPGEKVQNL